METDSPPTAENKPPKLRWYQWRLRSLFILTLLVAIGMSWLTVTIQGQRRQKTAAEAIEKAGGAVKSEPTWLGKLLRDDSLVRVTEVCLSEGTTDAELVHLQAFGQLKWLDIRSTQVTDAGLIYLRGLKQLQHLELSGTKVTDDALLHIEGLSQLHTLTFCHSNITDAGLLHLEGGLSQLHTPTLGYINITDAGLVHLEGLRQLRNLCLAGTKVTDAGLVHLQALGQLQLLVIYDTNVTDQGVKNLQQALPKCEINWHED